MVKENAEKDDGIDECSPASGLSENKLRHSFSLGDITWVKHKDSSWWPAQILKQENKSAMEAFHEVLEKELSHVNSPSGDYAEEAVNSKAKSSSREVRKQKDLKRHGNKDVKESGATDATGHDTEDQYVGEEHQELRNNIRTGVAARKGGMQEGARQSSPILYKDQVIDKASTENYAEGLRDKTGKQFALVRGKESCKMTETGTSVVRREGLRRSGRVNVKGYLDEIEDRTSQLSDTSASEDVTEVGNRTSENQNQHKDDSMLDGILAPHAEIRAMVKDILFSDIIACQHAAEMAHVDEVINGICSGSEVNMTGDASDSTKGGRGIKRSGSIVEAEPYNITHRSRKGKVDQASSNPNEASEGTPKAMNYCITENDNSKENNSNSLKGIIDTTTSRDVAVDKPGQQSLVRVKSGLCRI